MSLLHIPVRVIASDPAEAQAFSEVLSGGQAGALTLAGAGERPLAVLVCPSGDLTGDAGCNPGGEAGAAGIPAVFLGHGTESEGVRVLALPARLSEVLEALEVLASAVSGFAAARVYEGWRLDPARMSLRTPDERVYTLTDTEARLLACLFDAQGDDVGRDALLQRVWGYKPGLDTHTLETHIYRLRRKLEEDPANPQRIVTTQAGYRFAVQ